MSPPKRGPGNDPTEICSPQIRPKWDGAAIGGKWTTILWMVAKSASHQIETIRNHRLSAFTSESSFQGFLGGAGFRPSTVGAGARKKNSRTPSEVLESSA